MKIIQGEYENGVVRLLEEAPVVSNRKVLITFFEDNDIEEDFLRSASLQQPEKFYQAFMEDEREDLYQQYLNKNNDNQ